MNANSLAILESILNRHGHEVDLTNREEDRYFLFDRIANARDLDLAWSLFPNDVEIRARAEQVDSVSDIVAGWGYRTPKKPNRCPDAELTEIIRRHIAAVQPIIPDTYKDVRKFIEKGFDVEVVGPEAGKRPEVMKNDLFLTLYEAMGEFAIEQYRLEDPLLRILRDWAIYLTKCDEVAHYLLWPILKDVDWLDPKTPSAGFKLWTLNCREHYWIMNGDMTSAMVYIQPPWRI